MTLLPWNRDLSLLNFYHLSPPKGEGSKLQSVSEGFSFVDEERQLSEGKCWRLKSEDGLADLKKSSCSSNPLKIGPKSSKMGLISGILMGTVVGIALMAGWHHMMRYRSNKRIAKAVDIKLLGSLSRDDLKKICGDNFPEWISFPVYEQVGVLPSCKLLLFPFVLTFFYATCRPHLVKATISIMFLYFWNITQSKLIFPIIASFE